MGGFLNDARSLPPRRKQRVWRRILVAVILLFIPIAQFYSAFVALPLFALPWINRTSSMMGYTFAYFYPKNIAKIAIFVTYYILLFYFIETVLYRKTRNDI